MVARLHGLLSYMIARLHELLSYRLDVSVELTDRVWFVNCPVLMANLREVVGNHLGGIYY